MDTILLPYRISRAFIQAHPNWIFLYGCDYMGKSFFGQAYSAMNEPNTIGIPTVWKICAAGIKYLNDDMWDHFKSMVDSGLDRIPLNKGPIIPFPKIGEGHSQMIKMAPKLWTYMRMRIDTIKYPKIKIDYDGEVYPIYIT